MGERGGERCWLYIGEFLVVHRMGGELQGYFFYSK